MPAIDRSGNGGTCPSCGVVTLRGSKLLRVQDKLTFWKAASSKAARSHLHSAPGLNCHSSGIFTITTVYKLAPPFKISSFLIQNPSVLMQNSSLLIQNSSFFRTKVHHFSNTRKCLLVHHWQKIFIIFHHFSYRIHHLSYKIHHFFGKIHHL